MDSVLNLCRFCMSPNKAEIPIFTPLEDEIISLSEKINQCFRLEVFQDDDLPKKICCECSRSIDLIFSFWQVSTCSEKQLRAMVNGEKETENQFFGEPGCMYETIMLKSMDVVFDDSEFDIVIDSSETIKNSDTKDLKTDPTDTGKCKRSRNPENWARNIQKYLRNSGQPYVNYKNRHVPGKVFENKKCDCKRECTLPADERRKLFQSFWQLQDYCKQNIFLRNLIRSTATARGRPKDRSRKPKSRSIQYFLQFENQPAVRVCKTFFLDTFVITQKRIYKCLNIKVTEVGDLRGRIPSNKMDASRVESVKEHIQSVLRNNQSCGEKNNTDLPVNMMHKMYLQWCVKNAIPPVKLHYYYKVFNEHFKSSDFSSPNHVL